MEGFDVKAALDALLAFIGQNYILLLTALCLLILFRRTGVFARVRDAIEKALFDNWQLTLLASTGIALSLASGLHHLRRPAQFHPRAAAVLGDRLRHPGRDADRGVADR